MAQLKTRPDEILPIAGIPWTIKYPKKITNPDKPDEEIYGQTQFEEREIQLSLTKNSSEEQMARTKFHEVLHAVLGIGGLSTALFTGEDAVEREEALVECYENLLWPLIEWKEPADD